VSDSGRGIGREFLKTKLFTPFSQEDTLASGTGLGMSIVQQIVQLLGGSIDVKSQVNVGTSVTVTLVLEWPEVRTASDDNLCEPELPLVLRSRKHAVGKTICLVGFDSRLSNDHDTPPPTLASLRESLARYAKEWFGMFVVTGTLETKDVDIFLANESDDTVRYLEENPKAAAGRRTPLIVLCSNVSRYRDYASQGDMKFASKP
jgi:Histidine kinase-, DNA gyrase B-, and HSP90-like ATPase